MHSLSSLQGTVSRTHAKKESTACRSARKSYCQAEVRLVNRKYEVQPSPTQSNQSNHAYWGGDSLSPQHPPSAPTCNVQRATNARPRLGQPRCPA